MRVSSKTGLIDRLSLYLQLLQEFPVTGSGHIFQNRMNTNLRIFFLNFSHLIFFSAFLILLFSFNANLKAQSIVHRMYYYDPGLVITIGAGPSISFTDVKKNVIFPSQKPVNEWRLSGQMNLEWEFSPILSFRVQMAYAKISGSRPTSNRYFEARLFEMNSGIAINPLALFVPYRTDHKWHPTILLGIGLSYYNSKLLNISDNQIIAQRGYGSGGGLWGYVIEGIAIGGVGLSYKIDNHWSVKFETANRWMDSDKLDSVESTNNSSPYDFYNFTTIGISYKIFKQRKYPMISKK